MIIDLLTIFPDFFSSPLEQSLIKKARDKGIIRVNIYNIRDFATDKHKTVDDTPFGGGDGMVMKIEPIYRVIRYAEEKNGEGYKIYLSPKGERLNQRKVSELAQKKHLILLCGRYEGVDERVINFINEEISVGDYVLMGGESAALVVLEAVMRLVPGVVGTENSVIDESFSAGLLEYPQYTRPFDFMGYKVPDVLLTGNHKKIKEWRTIQALLKTYKKRPDLIKDIKIEEDMEKKLKEQLKEDA